MPTALALAVLTPLLWARHRELDLHSLDEDTPRVLGMRVERSRLVILLALDRILSAWVPFWRQLAPKR